MARLKRSIYEFHINNKSSPDTTELVERNQLIKLLYKPIIQVKGLSTENLKS